MRFVIKKKISLAIGLGAVFFCLPKSIPAGEPIDSCRQPPCIPAALVHAQNDKTALIVDKETQTAILWLKQNQWQAVARWPCSTGKSLGRKQVEGDQKTPEGIYFVTREVSGRFLSKTYGTRALPLDYPNWSDRRNHRSGSAIWLHGTNKRLEPLDSNGCIVFENRVIDALSRRIKVRSTPVILVDRLRWQSQRGAVLKSREILPILYRWQQALMGGSYSKFKRWYTPSAAPTMAWWHRWCRLRNQSVPEPDAYHSVVANEMVLQYKNSLIIVFDHYLRHGKKKIWCGRRKMYLKHEGHRVRIAREEYLEDALGQKSTTTDDPLFYTWRQITSFEYSLMAPAGKDCPTIKQSAWNLRRGL